MALNFLRLAVGAAFLTLAADRSFAEISHQPFDWSSAPLTAVSGEPLPAELFEGKTVLVVNTASRCGFTPQYAGLQSLWDRYRERGLVVLAIPANDFGGQEPGSNEEIAGFCERRFQITFPITQKASVVGPEAHPLFAWAARVSNGKARPQWNFYKLLIDHNGRLVAWYTSLTTPQSSALTGRIETLLDR